MSCKATRPLISRDDDFLVKPNTDTQGTSLMLSADFHGWTESVNNTLSQLGVTIDVINNIAIETARIAEFADLSTLDGLRLKVNEGSGYINPYEVLDLINIAGFDPYELYDELVAQGASPVSSDTFAYLQQLDFYYNQYLSAVSETSKCDSLYKIWQLIVQIELIVKTAQNWIARLKNFTLKKLIAKLLDIERLIKEFIEELAERIKQRIKQLIARILAKLTGCVEQVERIGEWIDGKVKDLETFFSKENLNRIKDDISAEFQKLVTPLDDFSPSNIAYMIWRLCSFIESIKNLFTNPLQFFQTGLTLLCQAQVLLEAKDEAAARRAVEAGGQRLTTQARVELRNQVSDGFETTAPVTGLSGPPPIPVITVTPLVPGTSQTLDEILGETGETTPYNGTAPAVTTIDVTTSFSTTGRNYRLPALYPQQPWTSDDTAFAASVTRDGTSHFTFANGILTMDRRARAIYNSVANKDAVYKWGQTMNELRADSNFWGDDDAGWKGIAPHVWMRLRRVSIAMQNNFGGTWRFGISSAYRNPVFNTVKGVKNSAHKSGLALDIGTSGWTHAQQVGFLYHCASNGLHGTGLYSSFIHVDASTQRNWNSGLAGPPPSGEESQSQYPISQAQASNVRPSFNSNENGATAIRIPVGGDFDKIKAVSFS